MATSLTIREEKLHNLAQSLGHEERIILSPCPGLMELAEKDPVSKECEQYLLKTVNPYKEEISAIVLGCTHYSFLKPLLQKLFPQIALFDGNLGLAKHVLQVLEGQNMLETKEREKDIIWYNTFFATNSEKYLYYQNHCRKFYELYIKNNI